MTEVSEYSSNFTIYLSLTEIAEKNELRALNSKMEKQFRYGRSSFSLEQLRKVEMILFG